MKKTVKVAMCQLKLTSLDVDANLAVLEKAFEEACASAEKPELLVFPELTNTGYVLQRSGDFGAKLAEAAELIPGGRSCSLISRLCKAHQVYCICGLCEKHPNISSMMYNSAAFFGPDGEFIGKHRKIYIPGEEKHYFIQGDSVEVYDTSLGKIGLQVCYDVWYPELSRIQALKGAEILVSVWNVAGSMAPWQVFYSFIGGRAIENRCFSVGCNRVGPHGQVVFGGNSVAVDPNGTMLNEVTDQEAILYATLHASAIPDARGVQPTLRDGRQDILELLCKSGEEVYSLKA